MMGDSDDDADVILVRRVRSAICANLGVEFGGTRAREVADQISAAIVEYVEAELCTCASGVGACPLNSHR